jgi:(p)ppGpp synthase/HD superfamily hydrolase
VDSQEVNVALRAKEFAKMAHAGQKRWDGSDYYDNHVRIVGEYVEKHMEELIPNNSSYWYKDPYWREQLIEAAYLHDVLEDTTYKLDDFKIFTQGIVEILTKKDGCTYFDYIKNIKESDLMVPARAIKIADLRHNMSNLKEGAMKDKYRFAIDYLYRGFGIEY